ncbi:MAG TPA: VF530 family protein [Gemmatimonas sp.]|nr:VF530 family protein [Gemmatimonas sp.]
MSDEERPESADSTASAEKRTNPLHGVTLERMLNELVDSMGWEAMADRVPVRCFESDPSVSSSLKFLRRTPWAREKVERMYLSMVRRRDRRQP